MRLLDKLSAQVLLFGCSVFNWRRNASAFSLACHACFAEPRAHQVAHQLMAV